MNTFLITRSTFPYLVQGSEGRVVFGKKMTGYTGKGEVTLDGSIHECVCSSAITGIMTSIARDIIRKGASVNGIALGPGRETYRDSVI